MPGASKAEARSTQSRGASLKSAVGGRPKATEGGLGDDIGTDGARVEGEHPSKARCLARHPDADRARVVQVTCGVDIRNEDMKVMV